jgi:nitrite reductase/ring-hydroxylating ferredoxin subunit
MIVDFFKALAGICRTLPLDPKHWEVEGSRVTVHFNDVLELSRPGGAVYLKGSGLKVPILVVRTNDGCLCVENRCTHMGRKLDPEPDGKTLRCCSVSRSTFDYRGYKIAGPANGPVKIYSSRVDNGKLFIELS